ncbi:hypothetical protein SAMN05421858_3784 [Haladaptatus litoreus]|uniref:Small CPxCG-related zinc finger protein n=1 Tax=Haladaptatus litoreus TaxID=553468 RepID=A0A1N7DNS7_9EURY|nr:hypothetical protein SAMN05421858_3784 [Haladaptatus litoreus]
MSIDLNATRQKGDNKTADTQCRNCGSFVTPQFTRVFGNNRNEVFGCFECMTATEVKRGHANHPETAARARKEMQ